MNSVFEYQSTSLRVLTLLARQDNYIYFIYNQKLNELLVVDPCDAGPVETFFQDFALLHPSVRFSEIWVTHHHQDHIGGVRSLRESHDLTVRGSQQIPGRIPCVTAPVEEINAWSWGEASIKVLFVPGHTLDHIAFWVQDGNESLLFSGDLLFGLGCGRLFEGTAEQMIESLKRVLKLPPETKIFCSHEYTERNLEFSLLQEPHLPSLIARGERIRQTRRQGFPTVPLTLSEEQDTNLFLRALTGPRPIETFRSLRDRRNEF